MEHHFTWFDMMGVGHHYTDVAATLFATLAITLFSIAGRLALGNGEAAIQPASSLSLKGFFEAFIELMDGMVNMVLGQAGRPYLPMFGAIFFYIIFTNLVGLIPGFTAATANINAALALGLVSFAIYNFEGFRHSGIHYLKHFMGPVWWLAWFLFPIEIISNLIRPLSLGIRLSVNMMADHALLGTFIDLTKVVVPIIFYGLGTFVSFVQALVFTMLSMVYVMMATADDH
jgi:F-type H+-transporting ATPase subunit a